MIEIHYFFSPTCTICDHQKEVLEQLKTETGTPVTNFNIFSDLDQALRYGIRSAPALAVIIDGKAVSISTGFVSRSELDETLEHWKHFLA